MLSFLTVSPWSFCSNCAQCSGRDHTASPPGRCFHHQYHQSSRGSCISHKKSRSPFEPDHSFLWPSKLHPVDWNNLKDMKGIDREWSGSRWRQDYRLAIVVRSPSPKRSANHFSTNYQTNSYLTAWVLCNESGEGYITVMFRLRNKNALPCNCYCGWISGQREKFLLNLLLVSSL